MWNKFLNTSNRYFIHHPLYGSKVDLAEWFIYPSTFDDPKYRDQSYYYVDSSSSSYIKLFSNVKDDWNTVWELPLYSRNIPMYMFDYISTPTFTTLIFEHWANNGVDASHLKCDTVDISISSNEKEMYFEYFYLDGSTKKNYTKKTKKVSDFYPGLSNYDNFTVPRKLIIELQGGGGGGGSSSWVLGVGDAGGGGSAGGYMTFVLSLSNITAWRIHLGFGGNGAKDNNQNGSPGDPTYIQIHPDIGFFKPLTASALGGGYGGAATGGGKYEGGKTSMESEYAERTDGTKYHVFWQLSSRQGAGGSYHDNGEFMNSIESNCTKNRGIAERSTAILERGSKSGGNCVGGGGGGASVFADGASSIRAGMGERGSKGSGGAGGSYNATASTDGGSGGPGGILVWY